MNIQKELIVIINEVLGFDGRAASFSADTLLLGAVPELDSMAVVSILNTLEERFGLALVDDEIDSSIFETVGSLVAFVESKLS